MTSPGLRPDASAPSDPQHVARAIWNTWNGGVSPSTAVARASDLRHFGAFTWRVHTEIGTIRRVLSLLERDPKEIRALALAWIDDQRARGIATVSLARRWSVLSSLVTFASRGAAKLGRLPRTPAPELNARKLAQLVARIVDARAWEAAAMIGLIGERGFDRERIASMRVREAMMVPCSRATRAAVVKICEGRKLGAFAFQGRSRGGSISPRGIEFVCEKWGTSSAALRRCAKGAA